MKTLKDKDMDWYPPLSGRGGWESLTELENDYYVRCLKRGCFHTDRNIYTVAVSDSEGRLDYTTPITSSWLNCYGADEFNQALKDISELPPKTEE